MKSNINQQSAAGISTSPANISNFSPSGATSPSQKYEKMQEKWFRKAQ
jgi:hypothetical protein